MIEWCSCESRTENIFISKKWKESYELFRTKQNEVQPRAWLNDVKPVKADISCSQPNVSSQRNLGPIWQGIQLRIYSNSFLLFFWNRQLQHLSANVNSSSSSAWKVYDSPGPGDYGTLRNCNIEDFFWCGIWVPQSWKFLKVTFPQCPIVQNNPTFLYRKGISHG